MKTMKYILGIMMSAALLFTGCMKEDIDELRAQQAENADRIAALEEWQETVNGEIDALQAAVLALQNQDYVKAVTPVTASGETIGYTITFSKSSPITIYSNTDSASALLKVAKDTDNAYYWQINDGTGTFTWLLDGSEAKVPVSTLPKVKADTNTASSTYGEWLVSTDGGTTWTPTGIEAEGYSIFAPNGIDSSNADYVEFTLADGTTKIRLPKYKAVGISFDQPTFFLAGTPQDIPVTSTGSTDPTNIRVVGLPTGWKYAVDYTAEAMKITVTPPATMTGDNDEGEATVLVGVGEQVFAMYSLVVTSSGYLANEIGENYYEKGVVVGWIYRAKTGTENGLVVFPSNIIVMTAKYAGVDFALNEDNLSTGKQLSDALRALPNNAWTSLSPWVDANNKGAEWFIPTIVDLNSSPGAYTTLKGMSGGVVLYVKTVKGSVSGGYTEMTIEGMWTATEIGMQGTSGSYNNFNGMGRMCFMREF